VTEAELNEWRADFENGRAQIQIEETEFDYADYVQFLDNEAESIAAFKDKQQQAFSTEVSRWKEEFATQPEQHVEQANHVDYSHLSSLNASMTGNIWKIFVEHGQEIKKGETVAIIEAMKMELPVYAEEDGIVKAIICRAGQTVHSGEPLVYME